MEHFCTLLLRPPELLKAVSAHQKHSLHAVSGASGPWKSHRVRSTLLHITLKLLAVVHTCRKGLICTCFFLAPRAANGPGTWAAPFGFILVPKLLEVVANHGKDCGARHLAWKDGRIAQKRRGGREKIISTDFLFQLQNRWLHKLLSIGTELEYSPRPSEALVFFCMSLFAPELLKGSQPAVVYDVQQPTKGENKTPLHPLMDEGTFHEATISNALNCSVSDQIFFFWLRPR